MSRKVYHEMGVWAWSLELLLIGIACLGGTYEALLPATVETLNVLAIVCLASCTTMQVLAKAWEYAFIGLVTTGVSTWALFLPGG